MKYLVTMICSFVILFANTVSQATESITPHDDQNAAIDPLAILANIRTDLTGIQAEFIQYELLSNNEKSDMNSGQVYMQTPAQFRWHYKEPVEQLIIADGENVWIYDEDLEQVTVKAQDNHLNPIYVIINDEKSQQYYDIKHELQTNGTDWISLTPKQKTEEIKTVWIAVKESLVKQIKVENQFQQTMIFEFHDIQKNPQFAADYFSFTPPEGVDVVRAMNQPNSEL